MASRDLPQDDGTSTEANEADLLEQAQPLAGEPATASIRRATAPVSPAPADDEGPTVDEIEQRQNP